MSPIGGVADFVLTALMIVFVAGIYLLPTLLAIRRKKDNVIPIALCNVFLGWTVIAWAIMLLEAFTDD